MRYTAAFCLLFMLSIVSRAGNVQVVLKNNVFYAPATGTYIETDILVIGNSISYVKNERGKYSGAVEVLLVYERDGKVAAFDKYILNTADIEDTSKFIKCSVDKKRYALPPGDYVMDATFTDVNSKLQKHIVRPLTVNFDSLMPQLSDISLVDTCIKVTDAGLTSDGVAMNKEYIKSGLFMTPMVLSFFSGTDNHLKFYAEAYNMQLAGGVGVLAMYSIYSFEDDRSLDMFSTFHKIVAKPVVPFFGEFDITSLPSGKYALVLEITG